MTEVYLQAFRPVVIVVTAGFLYARISRGRYTEASFGSLLTKGRFCVSDEQREPLDAEGVQGLLIHA